MDSGPLCGTGVAAMAHHSDSSATNQLAYGIAALPYGESVAKYDSASSCMILSFASCSFYDNRVYGWTAAIPLL